MGRNHGARTLDLAPGSPSVKRAYLDRSPAGDGGLAPPRQCLVQVSGLKPNMATLSRQRPRVRVPSSPPFIPKKLP
jgi:hypothetical protein